MSRIALSVCLLIPLAGCNSGSNTGSTSHSVPVSSAPQSGDEQASADESEASNSTTSDASQQVRKQATTPVKTSVRRKVNGADSTLDISFDDIDLPMQEDMVFRPFMLTDRARELDGKRIRIHGYMLPDSKTKGIKQFVLLKNTECKFGPGGQADHLVNVLMVDGNDAKYREDPVSVEGTLTIKPFIGPDGNTWSIYDLACDNVVRYRPRR